MNDAWIIIVDQIKSRIGQLNVPSVEFAVGVNLEINIKPTRVVVIEAEIVDGLLGVNFGIILDKFDYFLSCPLLKLFVGGHLVK